MLKPSKIVLCFLTFFILQFSSAKGEIQKVSLSWVPAECDLACSELLQKFLDKIPNARKVEINQPQGRAVLYWKPNAQFKIDDVRLPMMRLGLKLQILNIEAKGTIVHSGRKFFLDSIGDRTRIELLSPATASVDQYVEQMNIQSHYVTEPLLSKLLEIENKHLLATVKGYIFMLQRQQLQLIVQDVKATD